MEKKYIVDLMQEIQRQLDLPVSGRDSAFLSMATLALKDRLEILEEVASELRKETEKLQKDLYIDPLTLLYTRRGLESHLLQIDKSEQKKYGVILTDIARLKAINDNYGLDVGDYIIRSVGFGLRSKLKAQDFICRYGYSKSDEFLILTDNIDNRKDIVKRIRKIDTKLFDKPYRLNMHVATGEYSPFYESFESTYKRISQELNKEKKKKNLDFTPDRLR